MERHTHTQIYTSTLSRRERAWRGRRRHWARLVASAATVSVAVAIAVTGVAGHVI